MKRLIQYGSQVAAIIVAVCGIRVDAAEFMFRASVDGQVFEGKPLRWSKQKMFLLSRDGQLHEFDPRLAKEA